MLYKNLSGNFFHKYKVQESYDFPRKLGKIFFFT